MILPTETFKMVFKCRCRVAGTFRNDFFVTLVTAELDKDMKKTLKNLEVRLVVADSLGVELQVASYNTVSTGPVGFA